MTEPFTRYPGEDDETHARDVDLSHLEADFAEAAIEKREYGPIPDGPYQVNVEKVELAAARGSKTPC